MKEDMSITCFYPSTHLPKYPLCLHGDYKIIDSHIYVIIFSTISLESLLKLSRWDRRGIECRVSGLINTENHKITPEQYKICLDSLPNYKLILTLYEDGKMTGISRSSVFTEKAGNLGFVDEIESDMSLLDVSVVYYDPREMKNLKIWRDSDKKFYKNDDLLRDFISSSLFALRFLKLDRPFNDLRDTLPTYYPNSELNNIIRNLLRKNSTKKFVSKSLTLSQVYRRIHQILYVGRNEKYYLYQITINNIHQSFLLDMILGLIVTFFLFRDDSVNYEEIISQFVYGFISQLEELIKDLMKMPVGLKLNRPLNTALGYFFLYHIYLLKTYLYLMGPIYMSIIRIVRSIGVFGFSFILTFLCDIFSLATIHAYCFYAYAVHIYSFNINSLISLWRLFRGKKWNQLRSRVDSYSYQNDQLLLGCLCFTILIFILPTVLIYYIVFLTVRFLTLGVHLTLKFIVNLVTLFPVYSFILRTCNSNMISSSYEIQRKDRSNFQIVTVRASILEILNAAYLSLLIPASVVKNLLKDIVKGNLINHDYEDLVISSNLEN